MSSVLKFYHKKFVVVKGEKHPKTTRVLIAYAKEER